MVITGVQDVVFGRGKRDTHPNPSPSTHVKSKRWIYPSQHHNPHGKTNYQKTATQHRTTTATLKTQNHTRQDSLMLLCQLNTEPTNHHMLLVLKPCCTAYVIYTVSACACMSQEMGVLGVARCRPLRRRRLKHQTVPPALWLYGWWWHCRREHETSASLVWPGGAVGPVRPWRRPRRPPHCISTTTTTSSTTTTTITKCVRVCLCTYMYLYIVLYVHHHTTTNTTMHTHTHRSTRYMDVRGSGGSWCYMIVWRVDTEWSMMTDYRCCISMYIYTQKTTMWINLWWIATVQASRLKYFIIYRLIFFQHWLTAEKQILYGGRIVL